LAQHSGKIVNKTGIEHDEHVAHMQERSRAVKS
jgi:hypothetical protein